MKLPFQIAAVTLAFLFAALCAQAQTEIPIDTAKAIKTYTIKKYSAEMTGLNEGDIVKIEFIFRAVHWKENEGDSINTHIYGADHGDSAKVRVSNSARAWFMKLPDHGNPRHARTYLVFAKVLNEDHNNKRLELLGNTIESGFNKAVIKWTGQD